MKQTAVLILIALFGVGSWAVYTGDLYQQKSNRQKKLFTMQVVSTTTDDGRETTTAEFKDLGGNLAVREVATVQGSALVKTEIEQAQTKEKGLIEVKEGRVYFTLTKADGKVEKSDEKLAKTLVVPANFQKFVRDNWADLTSGKTVDFRYGVWFRKETVGFEIFKIKVAKVADQDAVVLKMKPSSFLISALVDPVIFTFALDGSKLLEMDGRVAPKQEVAGKFKDLDADVVYHY